MIKSQTPPEFKDSDPILRDFFVTKDGLIFSVPDYFHPSEGIRSILRYIPDENGPRLRKSTQKRYRKAGFEESFDYLKKNHPSWVSDVAVVPRSEISEILKPETVVSEIISGKRDFPSALSLIRRFENAGIPIESMGISGSLLPGLENEESDIDFMVYGNDWQKAKEALAAMKKEDSGKTAEFKISELDDEMWQTVYKKRKSPFSFEDFLAHEIRKGNRGMLIGANNDKNVYFDLLFARSENQIKFHEPIRRGKDTEKTEIEAVVTNADFAFDSPAIYLIDHPAFDEIYSYTHTYAGQAEAGEKIRARGMVEVIGDKKRLVIGTTREAPDEWIISLTLLEKQK
ncbi:DNA polymerase subunit beta [Methanimicrococcus sp. OttesenSCG-928-J09]|nr:DNA polymerase subunit beta [Methanimicrococcus sp. OttesenSCG-928-J09]